ncbi:XdhC family protein [Frateuria aurantia]|uniref:XdhC family protein n=1 Tax=Frateuria aurantia TaxID=81475 RepID=UPI0002D69B3E|nr:XdhC family protein [Frateuria aurantia]
MYASEICDAHSASTLIDAASVATRLSHELDRELPALQAALAATPFCIGALGSRRTHQRRVEKWIRLDFDNRDIVRVKAPIIIFPKVRDALSLALSAMADVAAARGIP